MNTINKIALIGGTGKAGKYLTRALIRHGYHFNILLRNPQSFNIHTPLATVRPGDARDPAAIRRLLSGCDAVLSMLGQPGGETTIFSQATANVLQAMKEHNMKRYIVITGLSVDAAGDKKSAAAQQGTEWMKANYPETTFDKQKEYELLLESGSDWTMIRLPLIDQTSDLVPVNVSLDDCPGSRISAASLAEFVVETLSAGRFIQQAPFIANR